MSKTLIRVVLGLLVVAGLAVSGWMAALNVEAQSQVTGTWTASVDTKENSKIHLSFERNNKGHRNQMGQSFEFADLQGLSREQALNGGPASFSLVREAGRIDCEGSFQNGKGSGTFRFTGNLSFVSAMKSRGFDFETSVNDDAEDRGENKLFAATTLNVTTALADDLLSAGFGKLQTEDLFKAAIFKIDSKFMREMKASGFENLGMEELVKARIFKIDANYIREAKADGVPLNVEELVRRKIGVARRN